MGFAIRNLRSDDQRQIALTEAFLIDNPDPGVRVRPRSEIEKAVATGQGIVVHDAQGLCGCSLVYKYVLNSSDPLYSEIGTMRITANGYDLQTFLAKVHLLQIFVEEDFDGIPPCFAVVEPGTASSHNLAHKVGLEPWQPSPALAAVRQGVGVPFSTSKLVLVAPLTAYRSAIDDLRSWHIEGNLFCTPKGNTTIDLELGWFDPSLLDIQI